VYILNHEQFPQDSQLNRKGSSNDVNALRKTFESLKCRVEVISNPALPDVKNKVMECKKYEQTVLFLVTNFFKGLQNDSPRRLDLSS